MFRPVLLFGPHKMTYRINLDYLEFSASDGSIQDVVRGSINTIRSAMRIDSHTPYWAGRLHRTSVRVSGYWLEIEIEEEV